MSRIGKQPVAIPSGVTVAIEGGGHSLSAKGPKGTLSLDFHRDMELVVEGSTVLINRPTNDSRHKALHGLTRALVANQIKGVSEGFERKLEIHGTGYSAEVKGQTLVLNIGFCHPVEIPFDKDLTVQAERGKPIRIKVTGIDKQKVGQLAANIRKIRPPDPYKQKGIRYAGEELVKKEGKAFGKK